MLLPEPLPSRWDLHGRMFGAEVRIRPIFWASTVLLGCIYYRYPKIGGTAAFSFWIAAVLVSLLAHELCHVLVARFFRVRPRSVLSGLGGQIYGLETLARWQRVLVLFSGSVGNLLILGVLWTIMAYPLPNGWLSKETLEFIANAVWATLMFNALWVLLNVLPLWPLDGGRAAVEICEALFGRRGRTLALSSSLLVCLSMVLSIVKWMSVALRDRFDERYVLFVVFSGVMTLYCYIFWLSTIRALWGEPTPLDEAQTPGRAA